MFLKHQVLVVLCLASLGSPASGQLTTPSNWRWATDRPARLVTAQDVPDSAWRFVSMPPGWHVTTGPGVTLFEPSHSAEGRFALESEIYLFPGEGADGYGLFVGGHAIGSPDASYIAFLVRRDGGARVERRSASRTEVVVDWVSNEAVEPHRGTGTSHNRLRVEVEPDSVRFLANGQPVLALSRDSVEVSGLFGLRVGPGLNLHVATLDRTERLAPVRPRPPGGA